MPRSTPRPRRYEDRYPYGFTLINGLVVKFDAGGVINRSSWRMQKRNHDKAEQRRMKALANTPEALARKSRGHQRAWAAKSGAERAACLHAAHEFVRTPEERARRRDDFTRRSQEPAFAQKRREGYQAFIDDPDRKRAHDARVHEYTHSDAHRAFKKDLAFRRVADPHDPFGKPHSVAYTLDDKQFDSLAEFGEFCRMKWFDNSVISVERVRRHDPRHAHPLPNGRKFYPDYFVIYRDGYSEYVDNKPRDTIEESAAVEVARFGHSDLLLKAATWPSVRFVKGDAKWIRLAIAAGKFEPTAELLDALH